jgi:hypothetical protein
MFNTPTYRHQTALEALFNRKKVASLSVLRAALGVRSRTTVFFALKRAGYYCSYSHAGRYYTLARIPRFDAQGLWSHDQVCFSKHGTLRATAMVLVQEAPEGCTHEELQRIVGVRLHDTLRSLVEDGGIGRERTGRVYLYVSADPERAAQQVKERQELNASLAEMLRVPTDEEVVEVLAEALRAAPEIPAPDQVARRLVARGMQIEPHHIQMVYEEHGLVPGKKTAQAGSTRSRR